MAFAQTSVLRCSYWTRSTCFGWRGEDVLLARKHVCARTCIHIRTGTPAGKNQEQNEKEEETRHMYERSAKSFFVFVFYIDADFSFSCACVYSSFFFSFFFLLLLLWRYGTTRILWWKSQELKQNPALRNACFDPGDSCRSHTILPIFNSESSSLSEKNSHQASKQDPRLRNQFESDCVT